MRALPLLLVLSLLALPAAAQEGAASRHPDRQVSVELSPRSTTFRVVEDGQVTDLREISVPDLPCGVAEEDLKVPAPIWSEAKKPPTGPQVVDILIMYSPAALREIGSKDLVVALAGSFVSGMNQDIYPGSGVTGVTLRLVGVVPAPWFKEENPDFNNKAIPKALRKYGADIFHILTGALPGVCGYGATFLGSMARWECGLDTFGHELGHIFVSNLHDLCFVQCGSRDFATTECEDASKIPPGCEPEGTSYYSNVTKLLHDLPMGDSLHNTAKAVMANAPKIAAIRKPKVSKSSH